MHRVIGGPCVGGVAVSDDGQYVYAPTYYGGLVSRYDTLDGNAQTTIPLGPCAEQVRKTPQGDTLIVQYNSVPLETVEAGYPLRHGTVAYTEDGSFMHRGTNSSVTL